MNRSASNHRLLALALIWCSLSVAIILWSLLVLRVRHAVNTVTADGPSPGIVEALQLNEPGFRDGFSHGLNNLTNPVMIVNVIGGFRLLVLLGVACVCVVVLTRAQLQSQSPIWRLLFALLVPVPAVVGLAMAPGMIIATSSAMAAAGLSNAGIYGVGIAEAFWPTIFGAVLAVPLLVVFVGQHFKVEERS